MKLYGIVIMMTIISLQLTAQCVAPKSIAFYDEGFYNNDTIIKDFVGFVPDSLNLQFAIDTSQGVVAWSWLWSPEALVNKDSVFTGIEYGKSRYSESFFYYTKGVLEGPFFTLRKDGYYAKGFCENSNCQVKEFYPDGSIYQKYETVDGSMFSGLRVVYGSNGNKIYEATFLIYDYNDDNLFKYCYENGAKCSNRNSRHIQVKINESCW